MGIFGKRKLKVVDKPIEDRTIPELIESVQHVNPMNSDSIIQQWNEFESARKFPKRNLGLLTNETFWLNPNEQTAFEYGNVTHQDFIDWANGTGIIVRGETQDQKDKFMRYAKAMTQYDLSLSIYAGHLWKLDDDSPTVIDYGRYRKNGARKSINLSKRRDSKDVIREMLSTFVQPSLRDIKDCIEWGRDLRDISRKNKDFMYAVCQTLAKGGHGYFDACNTPTEIDNLSWSVDLVFAKAYSLYVEELDPGIVECVEWCQSNRNLKSKPEDD
jgi:hypothetical protein